MTKISNETLGKVIVQVVKDFEKVAKEQEKNAKKQAEELQKVTDLAIEKIRTELDKANSVSIDLRPFEEKSKDFIDRLEKASENAKKTSSPTELGLKTILIYFGVLVIGAGAFYFLNSQAKELSKLQYRDKEFVKYLNSDKKRLDDWNAYVRGENQK